MSIHDDARAAAEGVYDRALSGLEAQVSSLSGELALSESRLSAVESELTQTRADLAAVTEALADYKATHPDTKPTTPTTLMGVTVTGPVRKEYTDLAPNVQVSRVFAENALTWSAEDQHKAFPDARWACSNTHDLSLEQLDSLLKSIPAADKAKIVAWCDTHEPENPNKKLVAAEYKARMRESAKVIRANGLKVASCVMGFSLKNDEWLQWVDPTVVDLIAFDKYNSGAKKSPPVYQTPVNMVADIVTQSKRFGKPWALWETGTDQFGDDAARVEWTKALRAEIVKQGGVTAIWFDRPATSGSGWNASMQPKAVAEAWLL